MPATPSLLGVWQYQPGAGVPIVGVVSIDVDGALLIHDQGDDGIDHHDDLDHVHHDDRLIVAWSGGTLDARVADVEHVGTVTRYELDDQTSQHVWPPTTVVEVLIYHQPATTPTTPGARNMATTTFKIDDGELGFSLTDPGDPVADATIADYTSFNCLVTSGVVTSSANFDTEEIPGTFCDPASETVSPSAATFTLEVEALQDPQDPAGLAQFLWDNDSGVSGSPVWFYLGLAAGAAPKIIGQCYLTPMDFGGEARTVLTASLSFPCEGRPEPEFGTTADV